jgi:hypothetical protein
MLCLQIAFIIIVGQVQQLKPGVGAKDVVIIVFANIAVSWTNWACLCWATLIALVLQSQGLGATIDVLTA